MLSVDKLTKTFERVQQVECDTTIPYSSNYYDISFNTRTLIFNLLLY